ncbi:hypothetical protein ACLB1N_09610 [Escherichia coli]
MVAQLVPQRLMGFIIGSWFLTTAGANLIGGYVAGMMAIPDDVTDPLMSLEVYWSRILADWCRYCRYCSTDAVDRAETAQHDAG